MKHLAAIIFFLLGCVCMMGAEKREFVEVTEGLDGWYRIMLPKESPTDTLLCGVFYAENEDARIFTLINVYNKAKEKKMNYKGIGNLEKESREIIQQYKGTEYEAQMEAQMNDILKTMHDLHGYQSDYNPEDWSETRFMTLKSSIAKECGGGRLWCFSNFRVPRHGLVAVARKDRSGNPKWGFINMEGVQIIPCIYDDVLDFNNRRYWSNGGFDRQPDNDYLPWTVVQKGKVIGMIDNAGAVKIPIKFGQYHDTIQMIFHNTPRGELAAARDAVTKKHGLIDRQGRWVIQPKYEEVEWDGNQECFYTLKSRLDSDGTFVGYDRTDIDL